MAEELKVYKRRWFYLLVCCLIQFSNGNTWISFASITFYTNEFYGSSIAALLFNTIFMILSIPVGFICAWWMGRFGVKSSYQLSAWFNFVGNVLRVVGCISSFNPHLRFAITLTGQTIAAAAQPFCMFMPTKLAGVWFAENERAIANTLASMANPIGIAVMYSTAPIFINDNHPDRFMLMNSVVLGIAAVPFVLHFFIRSNTPPTPVSHSRAEDSLAVPPFGTDILLCLKSTPFIVLCLCLGGGVGLFNVLYNNLQPALCVQGYSATFTSLMGALLIFSGLVGAAISGIIVDKTGKFEEVMKFSFLFAGVAAASLYCAITRPHVQGWIAASIFLFGAGGFAIFPIGLEMGVEATYPVSEATSTGLIIMLGQVQGVVYVIVTNLFAGTPDPHQLAVQTCSPHVTEFNSVQTWDYPFLIWSAAVLAYIIIFTFCFRPVYKRREYEKAKKAGLLTPEAIEELPKEKITDHWDQRSSSSGFSSQSGSIESSLP